jgi:carboxypeptidase D
MTYKSVQGKDLWVMHISDNVTSDEPDEPSVFFSGVVHGDEPDGAELSMYLINELLTSTDTNIRNLVNKTDIYIMPVVNPDGYTACTRTNNKGYNINRSFTDYSSDSTQSQNQLSNPLSTTTLEAVAKTAPEAAAVMKYSSEHNFVLSADLHANGGVAVVNYPYDNTTGIRSGDYAKSPDDDLFKYISKVYSSRDSQMWDAKSKNAMYGVPFKDAQGKSVSALTVNTTFPYGIVNGSDWFAAAGTFQDWHYRYMGTNAVTVEVRDVATGLPPIGSFRSDGKNSRL